MQTTVLTQLEYPLLEHISISYYDKDHQACNFIETQFRNKLVIINTIIFYN